MRCSGPDGGQSLAKKKGSIVSEEAVVDQVPEPSASPAEAPKKEFADLKLDKIVVDHEIQSRVSLNEETIDEYMDLLEENVELPPPVVYWDGEKYWLAAGFHRVAAGKKAEFERMKFEIRTGGKREAILCSVGENVDHGLRRTNADKRHAVQMLLKDDEWRKWNPTRIGAQCQVDSKTVKRIREEMEASSEIPRSTTDTILVKRGNTEYEMKKPGRKSKSAGAQEAAPEPQEAAPERVNTRRDEDRDDGDRHCGDDVVADADEPKSVCDLLLDIWDGATPEEQNEFLEAAGLARKEDSAAA